MTNKTDFSNATIKITDSKDVKLGNINAPIGAAERPTKHREPVKTKEPIAEVSNRYFDAPLSVKVIVMISAVAILGVVAAFKF